MKLGKRLLALTLALAMLAAFAVQTAAFDGYDEEAVLTKWNELGVLAASDEETDGVLTRSELADLICMYKGLDGEPESAFSDADPESDKNLLLCADEGYFVGNGGMLRPNDAITREEAAVVLSKAFNVKKYGKPDLTYSDRLSISKWAKEYVDALEDAGRVPVEDGGEFLPAEPMSETEAVVWLDVILRGDYTWYYLQTLEGGFADTYEEYAAERGMTGDEFLELCKKAASEMTWAQRKDMSAIRAKQLGVEAEETLVQKVITTYDMNKYLSGEYKTPRGFISVCADVKSYRTTADCFTGLRLDYEGTYFDPADSFAVIRFVLKDTDDLTIPLSPINGGDVTDPYPFGGCGFTTAGDGVLPSPEWKQLSFADICDGAEIYEVFPDGTQLLRGEFSAEDGRFYRVG